MARLKLQKNRGNLYLQWTVNGQRYSLYGLGNWDSHSDKAKAESLARLIEADILEKRFDTTLDTYKAGLGKAVKRLGTPVEMFALWMEHLKVSDKNYRTHYEPVLQVLMKQDVRSFHPALIPEYLSHLKPSSYNGRISCLRRFGAWLVSEGYLPLNPYRNLKPKQGETTRVKPFTGEQVQAVLKELYSRNTMVGAYYAFLFLTGCRPAEVIGLLTSKVDNESETITIDSVLARGDDGSATAKGRVRKHTKTGDVRMLPMNRELAICIDNAYAWQIQNGVFSELVFCNSRGEALDDTNLCDRYWKPALIACGIPYQRPYVTRHTAASTVIENGGTLADAAKLLGHRDLRMVSSVYGHAVKGVQLPSYDG